MPRKELDGRLIDVMDGSPRTGLVGEIEVASYWHQRPRTSALAVVLGPTSGLMVLDVDQHGSVDGLATLAALEAKHGRLPPSPTVLTPSGHGRHIYFRYPVDRDLWNGTMWSDHGPGKVNRAPGLEILTDRAAATLPPSTKGGKPYRWSLSRHVDWLPIAPAPGWLLALATKPPLPRPKPVQPIEIGEKYVQAALDDELLAVRNASKGGRNEQLNRSAWALSRFAREGKLSAEQIEALLVGAAPTDKDFKESEAKAIVKRALRARASR